MRYFRRPEAVEAFQFLGFDQHTPYPLWANFLLKDSKLKEVKGGEGQPRLMVRIKADVTQLADVGDYIIENGFGELAVLSEDRFKAMYWRMD